MPRKTKNLYQRGQIWWGCLEIAGCRHRSSLRTTDLAEAKDRLKGWRVKLERAVLGNPNEKTFKEAVVKWSEEVLPRSVKPSVAKRYLSSIAQLAPAFRTFTMGQITPEEIGNYISARVKQKVTNATIKRDLTALSRLLAACVAWGWRTDNPAKVFDRSIIRETRQPICPPTPEDLEAVLRVAPDGMADVLRLLDATGARESEIVFLTHAEVNWRLKQINLLKTKTSRPRTLPWLTCAGDAGLILARLHNRIGPLFLSEQRDTYKNFSSNFRRVMKQAIAAEAAAGRTLRSFRVHDLRHAYAIRWLKKGGNLYDLSKHLGHRSVKTTEIYLDHLTVDEQKLAQFPPQSPEKSVVV